MEAKNALLFHSMPRKDGGIIRKFLTPVIVMLLVSSIFSTLSPVNSNETSESFAIPCDSIRLSIESYKREGGWTPLVLSLGDLKLFLWMDKDGRVNERKRDRFQQLSPVFIVNLNARQLFLEKKCFPFKIYEQNQVRTRMKLLGDNIPVRIEISDHRGKVILFIEENRLKLNRLSGEIKTIGPGMIDLRLNGPAIHTDIRLPSRAVIENSTPSAVDHDNQTTLPRVVRALPSRQRAALIALYNSTNGDDWTYNSGWKDEPLGEDGFGEEGSENSWYGITCSEINPKVRKIDLHNNNLEGTIPPELGKLLQLIYLNLSENLLSGKIPDELGVPGDLANIFLNANQLTGNIPPELGNLARLGNLFLDSNQLSGEIPVELGNLTNLRSLQLNSNRLTGSIPPELGNLSGLLYLYLSNNQLQGHIPGQLGNLTRLVSLLLNSNQLSGEIPPELGNLTDLAFLCLDSNELTGQIPPELINLQNLALLQLQDNRLGGPLPAEMGGLLNLQYLYLNGNKLKDLIPVSFSNLDALIDADFSYNALLTDSEKLREFLNSKDPDWESTQTIAPSIHNTRAISNNSVLLTWTPITYTQDSGHYKVYYSLISGTSYKLFDTTEDKRASQMTVSGLKRNTTYYFRLKTRTEPHENNKNAVVSESGDEVSDKTKNYKTLTISGTITDPEGKGIPGVTLTFSNFGGSTKTNDNGHYSHGVIYGWSGIVKPGKKDYFFYPASRTYSNIALNKKDKDYIAIYKMIRTFHVERRQEGAWIVRRDYARININVVYSEYAAKFTLYRKQQEGEYRLLHEFFPSDLQQGSFTFDDKYINKGTAYTFKVTAMDTAGAVIATSEERTI